MSGDLVVSLDCGTSACKAIIWDRQGNALAVVTTPLAIRPGPPSFSLAKMKMVSPLAIRLPAYIVFCALKANVSARGSPT